MKMNISLLADTLAKHFPLQQVIARHKNLTLGHARLYTPGASFQEGGVYLAESEIFPNNPVFPEECGIISIGPAAKIYREGCCDYIELDSAEDFMEVFNQLQHAYDQYDSWHNLVKDALASGNSLQEIFDATLPLFDNPIYCTDASYNLLAYSEYPGLTEPPQPYNDPDIRNRMLNELKTEPHYEQSFYTTEPTLWSDCVTPYDTIYCNIFYEETYYGKVMIDERIRTFQPSDYVLAGELCNIVKMALARSSLFPGNEIRVFDKLIIEALNGMSIDHSLLQHELKMRGWSAYTCYFCAIVYMDERDLVANSVSSCCTQIERNLKYCCAFPYEDKAVIIVPLEAWKNKTDYFASDLSPILRDGLYKAAISGVFTDFAHIRSYYEQAVMALNMGLKSDSTDWIFYYEQYVLSYMLECCSGTLPPLLLCRPQLLKLMEYDKNNNVPYVKTLKAFIENNCSQAQTCRSLYLHRSTLLQRLTRIRQITGYDLTDEKICLYLRLIFAVFDYNGIEL